VILDKILTDKLPFIEACKKNMPLAEMERLARSAPHPKDFEQALLSAGGDIAIIAEVKKASPSKGLIRPDFCPADIARAYQSSGAAAISVLTDEKYFQGSLNYLKAIRVAVSLPILRKDFIIDPYQIFEARAAGADAVLLIAAALPPGLLRKLKGVADELGMASLVEAHTAEELDEALLAKARIVGINNRNLQTFETSLNTTLRLAAKVPPGVTLVSESGIFTRDDVLKVKSAGVRAVLVGESLMRQPNPGDGVRMLLGE
jgi:indole-3-glycerol phosphate synthase